jgi:hypothetical protein
MMKNPSVTVRVGQQTIHAMARIVKDEQEEMLARNLLANKYKERESDDSLSEWARTALPVALDLVENI